MSGQEEPKGRMDEEATQSEWELWGMGAMGAARRRGVIETGDSQEVRVQGRDVGSLGRHSSERICCVWRP